MPETRRELRLEERESVLERGEAAAPLAGVGGTLRDESEPSRGIVWSAMTKSMQVREAKGRSGRGRGGRAGANHRRPIDDIILCFA